jgi:hypothetical protein
MGVGVWSDPGKMTDKKDHQKISRFLKIKKVIYIAVKPGLRVRSGKNFDY